MSGTMWISCSPVSTTRWRPPGPTTNDGVTSSPEAALSRGNQRRGAGVLGLSPGGVEVRTRYSTTGAISGFTAAKNGIRNMSVSQKTWPL